MRQSCDDNDDDRRCQSLSRRKAVAVIATTTTAKTHASISAIVFLLLLLVVIHMKGGIMDNNDPSLFVVAWALQARLSGQSGSKLNSRSSLLLHRLEYDNPFIMQAVTVPKRRQQRHVHALSAVVVGDSSTPTAESLSSSALPLSPSTHALTQSSPQQLYRKGRTTRTRKTILQQAWRRRSRIQGSRIRSSSTTRNTNLRSVGVEGVAAAASGVVSAALLVTGNTVGAGCLVLPQLTAEAGMAPSLSMFAIAYLIHLISGYTIAQVSIDQHHHQRLQQQHHQQLQQQQSTKTASKSTITNTANAASPTSAPVAATFQQMTESSLGTNAGTCVAVLSLFINAAVMAFNLGQVGVLGESLTGLPGFGALYATLGAMGMARLLLTTPTTNSDHPHHLHHSQQQQQQQHLSTAANLCVGVLGISFVGLAAPHLTTSLIDLDLSSWTSESALAATTTTATLPTTTPTLLLADAATTIAPPIPHVHAPIISDEQNMMDHDGDWTASWSHAAPIIFMSLVYQNIVPSIVKQLKYDPTRIYCALTLGTFLPLCLYLFWCTIMGSSTSLPSLTAAAATDDHASMAIMMMTTHNASSLWLLLFTAATLVGSMIGTGMSLTEEVQSIMWNHDEIQTDKTPPDFTVATTAAAGKKKDKDMNSNLMNTSLLAMGVPLVAALALGPTHILQALEWAGSLGSPLLYGVVPAALAFRQRQRSSSSIHHKQQQPHHHHHHQQQPQQQGTLNPWWEFTTLPSTTATSQSFLYSLPSLGLLGGSSIVFAGHELLHQLL